MMLLLGLSVALSSDMPHIETTARNVLVDQCLVQAHNPADEADCYIQWGGLDIDPLNAIESEASKTSYR